ncbi:hypothetical protein QOT17_004097 [Balamuthia mandrillaris]
MRTISLFGSQQPKSVWFGLGHLLSVSFLVVVIVAGGVANAEYQEDCVGLGFTSSLVCSSCEELAKHVEDAELTAECKRCCTPEVPDTIFASATLTISKSFWRFYPQLTQWINDNAHSYPNLEIHVRTNHSLLSCSLSLSFISFSLFLLSAALLTFASKQKTYASRVPALDMKNEDGEVVTTISIASWDVDTLKEFLDAKLASAPSSSSTTRNSNEDDISL